MTDYVPRSQISSQDLGLAPFATDEERFQAQRRRRGRGEASEAERLEAELVAEIEAEDKKLAEEQKRLAGLPPESSGERERRELRQRVERLEAEKANRPLDIPELRGVSRAESQQNRRREALRLLRNRRQAHAAHEALMAHRGAARGEIRRLEGAIEAADRELAQEEQRHAAARDAIAGRRRELNDTLARVMAPLAEGETSKDRLADVLGVKV